MVPLSDSTAASAVPAPRPVSTPAVESAAIAMTLLMQFLLWIFCPGPSRNLLERAARCLPSVSADCRSNRLTLRPPISGWVNEMPRACRAVERGRWRLRPAAGAFRSDRRPPPLDSPRRVRVRRFRRHRHSSSRTLPAAVVTIVWTSWTEAVQRFDFRGELVDSDGRPIIQGDEPVAFRGQTEVGRPAGIPEGSELMTPLVAGVDAGLDPRCGMDRRSRR